MQSYGSRRYVICEVGLNNKYPDRLFRHNMEKYGNLVLLRDVFYNENISYINVLILTLQNNRFMAEIPSANIAEKLFL